MKIKLDDTYYMTTDGTSFVLAARAMRKGVETLNNLSYHHTPEGVLMRWANLKQLKCGAESWKELLDATNEIRENVKRITKELQC